MSVSEVQGTDAAAKSVRELDTVVIRFAGDSGDGMQMTGTQFTNESALAGNDLARCRTFPPRSARPPARSPASAASS